jgi:hypothetical protein
MRGGCFCKIRVDIVGPFFNSVNFGVKGCRPVDCQRFWRTDTWVFRHSWNLFVHSLRSVEVFVSWLELIRVDSSSTSSISCKKSRPQDWRKATRRLERLSYAPVNLMCNFIHRRCIVSFVHLQLFGFVNKPLRPLRRSLTYRVIEQSVQLFVIVAIDLNSSTLDLSERKWHLTKLTRLVICIMSVTFPIFIY